MFTKSLVVQRYYNCPRTHRVSESVSELGAEPIFSSKAIFPLLVQKLGLRSTVDNMNDHENPTRKLFFSL